MLGVDFQIVDGGGVAEKFHALDRDERFEGVQRFAFEQLAGGDPVAAGRGPDRVRVGDVQRRAVGEAEAEQVADLARDEPAGDHLAFARVDRRTRPDRENLDFGRVAQVAEVDP